ncbi:MAG TPA: MraY family glycosyltransferase [Bacteroidales bacterium]|jgi:UDP-N-acetylmuramyl pentapeptide phosphotransferase/UDP-N-acetylglucosamine-1-phosphate transferase|nr:MAG: Decaprenyl-phosphate N-acetylglucosaminephosphotransferase [Bacteroidetes bacterium ADurb.Bin145]HOU03061.1 MraY family glycosyltransferase [Bacteroidales bacterium]HQK66768.1 MraY family glycosyltransferase [Bacteroidales bacterium]
MFDSKLIMIDFPSWLMITTGFIISFMITFFGIPSVHKIARIKNIYDIPGIRASHNVPIPRLGGTMIFAGIIISSVLFTGLEKSVELKYFIAGLLVLFFIGLKDDIISLVYYKKAAGQLLACIILVIFGGIRVNLNCDFLGTGEICYVVSTILSIILAMLLINSLNFIDGIDGLAAGVGIIASVSFGLWFIIINQVSYAVICFSLTGSLIAFFWYNVFSRKYKIFLGDTGSMVIGFLLAVFLIRSLELNYDNSVFGFTDIAASLVLAILIVPVFDFFRIVFVRILHGKSPFKADHNHIHHKVLKLAGSHLKATCVMLFVNIVLISVVILFRSLGNKILIPSLLSISIVLSLLLTIYLVDPY